MPILCCVPLCKSNSAKKTTPKVTFHNFTKDNILQKVWIHRIKRDTRKSKCNPKPFKISKYTKVSTCLTNLH